MRPSDLPRCPHHGEEWLIANRPRRGWLCQGCVELVVGFDVWPGPDEPLSEGLPIERLPVFLARPIRNLDREEHPVLRLWGLCDVAETLLRLCTILGAADIEARLGEFPDTVARAFLEGDRIRRPTLDGWLRLANVVAQNATTESLIPELANDLPQLVEPMLRDNDWGVIALRNDLAHGAVPDEHIAAILVGPRVRHVRQLLSRLSWLADIEFAVHGSDSHTILRGPEIPVTGPLPTPDDPHLDVHARRGTLVRSVWPVVGWLVPTGEQAPVPSIYVRATSNRLEHLPMRKARRMEFLKGRALRRFENLFRLSDRGSLLGQLEDFDADFKDTAARLVGRTAETKDLLELTDRTPRPAVIWLSGKPGFGKSALVSKLAVALEGRGERMLMWRFRQGDPRCSTAHFLRYALKRLGRLDFQQADDPHVLTELLRETLSQQDDRPVVLVVDGLDEIERVDSHFLDLPFCLAGKRTLWICAGRQTPALDRAFAPTDRCIHAYSGEGLGGLSDSEVAEWLVTTIPDEQRSDLIRDRGRWLEDVMDRSQGMPLYIQLLVEELTSDERRVGGHLPVGLDAFYAQLLVDNSVDDAAVLVPHLVATVSVLAEAPTLPVLCELLIERSEPPETGADSRDRVLGALERACNLIATRPDSVQRQRYYPVHESFREHVLRSAALRITTTAVRRRIHDRCVDPTICRDEEAGRVFFDLGILQLVHDGQIPEATQVLSDVRYALSRLQNCGRNEDAVRAVVAGLVRDIRFVLERSDHEHEHLRSLRDLLRDAHHQIVRGGAIALFQLLIQRGGHWRTAANRWAIDTNFRGEWLEVLATSAPSRRRSFLTLELPHQVEALAFHPESGHLIALHGEHSDATLWDPATGSALGTVLGCRGRMAIVDSSGTLTVLSGNRRHRWNVETDGRSRRIGDDPLPGQVVALFPGTEGTNHLVARAGDVVVAIDPVSGEMRARVEVNPEMDGIVLPLPGGGALAARHHDRNFESWYRDGDPPANASLLPIDGVLDWSNRLYWTIIGHVVAGIDTRTLDALDGLAADLSGFPTHPTAAGAAMSSPILGFATLSSEVVVVDLHGRRTATAPVPEGHGWIDIVALSADGSRLAAASRQSREGAVWIFEVAELLDQSQGQDRAPAESRAPVRLLSIDPEEGTVLCVWLNGRAVVFDHETGHRVRDLGNLWAMHSGHPGADLLVASRDGRRLAFFERDDVQPKQIDVRTGQARRLEEPDEYRWPEGVHPASLEYSDDGEHLFATTRDGRTFCWNATTGNLPSSPPSTAISARSELGAQAVWFNPDPAPPEEAVVSNASSWIEIIHVELAELAPSSGRPLRWNGLGRVRWDNDEPITAAAATPDGRIVIGDDEGRVLFLQRRRGVTFTPHLVP